MGRRSCDREDGPPSSALVAVTTLATLLPFCLAAPAAAQVGELGPDFGSGGVQTLRARAALVLSSANRSFHCQPLVTMKPLMLLSLSVLLAAAPAAQTTYTWNGANPGDWAAAGNWSPNGVPGAGDAVVIGSGQPVLGTDATVAEATLSGGSLSGDGNLTVTGTFTWSGGTLNGRNYADTAALTIPAGATLHIVGELDKGLRGRDIFNDGTILWEGTGNLEVMWSTHVENRAGATLDIRSDAAWTRSNGTLDLVNAGLVVKSAGTGTTRLNYPYGDLINEGVIRVEVGTLLLTNGISAFSAGGDGAFEIESGAVLRFNQATYNFGPGSSVGGEGTLTVTSGTARLGTASLTGPTVISGGYLLFTSETTPAELADVALSGPQFSGGRLGGGVVNVNGLLTWTGGYLGTGNGGVINLLGGASAEGDGAKYFGDGTTNNAATFTWTGAGNLVVNSSVAFNNLEGALFDIRNDAAITRSNGYLDFTNAGLVVKSAGAGSTSLNLVFAFFDNDGEVRAETGTLFINNDDASDDTGSYVVEEGATLRFGGHRRTFTETASIEGNGTLVVDGNMDFRMGGTIRPGLPLGTLTAGGDYPAPQAAGALEIELGVTGGEEDGVDNSGVDNSKLYTQPSEVLAAYDKLNPIGAFTVAAQGQRTGVGREEGVHREQQPQGHHQGGEPADVQRGDDEQGDRQQQAERGAHPHDAQRFEAPHEGGVDLSAEDEADPVDREQQREAPLAEPVLLLEDERGAGHVAHQRPEHEPGHQGQRDELAVAQQHPVAAQRAAHTLATAPGGREGLGQEPPHDEHEPGAEQGEHPEDRPPAGDVGDEAAGRGCQ